VGKHFLTIHDVHLNRKINYKEFLVCGLIAGKTKVDFRTRRISAQPFKYTTTINSEFNYIRKGFSDDHHIAFTYDGEIVTDENPQPHKAPYLHGISGGGVWGFFESIYRDDFYLVNLEDNRKNRKLLGIILEYDPTPSGKAILATRFYYVANFIGNRFGLSKRRNAPLR
jgi:hypothetical protein